MRIQSALLGLGRFLEERFTICFCIATNKDPNAYRELAIRKASLFTNWHVAFQCIAGEIRRSYSSCREAREVVPYADLDRCLQQSKAVLELLVGYKIPHPPEAFATNGSEDVWVQHIDDCFDRFSEIDDSAPNYRSVCEELMILLDRFPVVDEQNNVSPPHVRTASAVPESVEHELLDNLMVVYAGAMRDGFFGKAMEVIRSDDPVARKLEELDKVMKIPETASASDIASLFGKSSTAVKNTPWWKERMKLRGKSASEREEYDDARTEDYEEHGSRHKRKKR